jgi:hypothetical protein
MEKTKAKMTESAKTHAANQATLNMSNTTVTLPPSSPSYGTITVAAGGAVGSGQYGTGVVGNITAANLSSGTVYSTGYGYASMGVAQQSSVISVRGGPTNDEIVRLNRDGSVTWAQEINIDEAAKAFAQSISVGAELAAGITQTVKYKMRDSVFEDIINIAREKGSLTADDLTYLLEASKIVEKLKGPKE